MRAEAFAFSTFSFSSFLNFLGADDCRSEEGRFPPVFSDSKLSEFKFYFKLKKVIRFKESGIRSTLIFSTNTAYNSPRSLYGAPAYGEISPIRA